MRPLHLKEKKLQKINPLIRLNLHLLGWTFVVFPDTQIPSLSNLLKTITPPVASVSPRSPVSLSILFTGSFQPYIQMLEYLKSFFKILLLLHMLSNNHPISASLSSLRILHTRLSPILLFRLFVKSTSSRLSSTPLQQNSSYSGY